MKMRLNRICFVSFFVALFFNAVIFAEGGLLKALDNALYKNSPNFKRAMDVLATDVSDYYDFLIKDCKLPDGRIADVRVFNNVMDQIRWQNIQARLFSNKWKKNEERDLKEAKRRYDRDGDYEAYIESVNYTTWHPTGPLTPFYKQWGNLEDKYGMDEANKICVGATPVSYYLPEDLGQLSEYMKTLDCAAQACYEDDEGVYLLTIVRTKWIPQNYIVSAEMKKLHKNEFVYEVGFIPKEMYKFEPVKLDPAKTKSFDPSVIPDSDRDLTPGKPSGNGAYYYDANLANSLQWLAVKIACKGVYDMAYTGDFSARNPEDCYKTSFIKNYLAKNDGKASKGTLLFEGICFDYADFAYQELTTRKVEYPNVARFWMVGTFENSSDIVIYKIVSDGEKPTMMINNTPVVVFSYQHIVAHDRAVNHAWVWIQTTDGTIYWVDPTWTDNTGRPVYGIVRGDREIPLEPDSRFSVR